MPEHLKMDELDGRDPIGRMVSLGSKGAFWGAFYGAALGALREPIPTPGKPVILQTLRLMATSTIVAGGGLAFFAGTTSCMALIREKDDWKNWSAGGAMTGIAFGAWKRSFLVGSVMVSILAVAGGVAKYTGVYRKPFRDNRYDFTR